MPYSSPFPPLDIPKCNLLSYLFPPGRTLSTKPLWIDAANPSNNLSPVQMLSWVKRFAVGLDRLGVKEQQTVMVFTPNHLYVPMIYLAAAGIEALLHRRQSNLHRKRSLSSDESH